MPIHRHIDTSAHIFMYSVQITKYYMKVGKHKIRRRTQSNCFAQWNANFGTSIQLHTNIHKFLTQIVFYGMWVCVYGRFPSFISVEILRKYAVLNFYVADMVVCTFWCSQHLNCCLGLRNSGKDSWQLGRTAWYCVIASG